MLVEQSTAVAPWGMPVEQPRGTLVVQIHAAAPQGMLVELAAPRGMLVAQPPVAAPRGLLVAQPPVAAPRGLLVAQPPVAAPRGMLVAQPPVPAPRGLLVEAQDGRRPLPPVRPSSLLSVFLDMFVGRGKA